MPINKADYPPNWPEISNQVKEEAGWMCEWCGVPHKAIIRRFDRRFTLVIGVDGRNHRIDWYPVLFVMSSEFEGVEYISTDKMSWSDLRFHGLTKVILTTAHLDRNTKNNARKNLAALCQRCHLSHDVLQHVANRKYGRLHAKDHQQKLQI